MSETRIDKIRAALNDNLAPKILTIKDESHLHAGHKSAGGLGHYSLEIMVESLSGLSIVQGHKKIYAALGPLMETDIHALSIKILKAED